VGFSDGEACFLIVKKSNSGSGVRFSFVFQLGLHRDDLEVLTYIAKTLGIGRVTVDEKEAECRYIVSDIAGVEKLIVLFDEFNLNTTKHMDYLAFKKAFFLYRDREGVVTESLVEEILKIKSGMNNNRTDFTYPVDHRINITSSWLLGFVEAEGSFHLYRDTLAPAFTIAMSIAQLPVVVKIKEFLVENLGFDDSSK